MSSSDGVAGLSENCCAPIGNATILVCRLTVAPAQYGNADVFQRVSPYAAKLSLNRGWRKSFFWSLELEGHCCKEGN